MSLMKGLSGVGGGNLARKRGRSLSTWPPRYCCPAQLECTMSLNVVCVQFYVIPFLYISLEEIEALFIIIFLKRENI